MTDLEDLLSRALHDRQGRSVTAHLRRRDEDYWDRLVVAEDGQPLTFRGPPSGMSEEVVLNDNSVLMVLACTPAGVSPEGHLAVPADDSGSPLGKIIVVVNPDGITEVEPPNQEVAKPPPPGRDSFAALLNRAAMRQGNDFRVTNLEAQDGGTTTVLLAWDQRPLLLWFEQPSDGARALMCLATHSEGIVAEVVDSALRPLHSNEGLAQLLSRDGD
jgi:hypothetical protein